jgi:O-antigen/teichoic acid export membrane protein
MNALFRLPPNPKLQVNIVANYLAKFWTVAVIYLFVPFYIKILGIAAYGLIAFYSMALMILFIADAGLSAAFSRQAARERDPARLLNGLSSTEVMIFGMLFIGGATVTLSAPAISEYWLKSSEALSLEMTTACVRLMPLALIPQVAISLYFGGLMGRQRQLTANGLMSAFIAVRGGLVLVPIYIWSSPYVFFAWQAASGWLFLLIMRRSLIREIAQGDSGLRGRFSWATLRSVAGYAAGMFAISIIAGLNTQLDRLVVSKLRPLDEFAYYSLAATLGQVPVMLAIPISAALLPMFTQLTEFSEPGRLRRLYESNTYLVATIAAAAACAIAWFPREIIGIWLPGKTAPAEMASVVAILSLGSMFLALQLLPFQLSLANGHNLSNVVLGMIALVVSIPLQIWLTIHYGLVGAAVPWLVLNFCFFVVLGIILNCRFYSGKITFWFLRLSLWPIAVCALTLGCGRWVADAVETGPLLGCMVAGVFSVTAFYLSYLGRPRASVMASGGASSGDAPASMKSGWIPIRISRW